MTNNYDLTEKYYHEDLIKAIDYHHGFVRRSIMYNNPFESKFGLEYGCLTLDDVKEMVSSCGIDESTYPYEEYCFGSGWDARSSLYIIICYISYLQEKNLKNEKRGISDNRKKDISLFLIFPYMYMRKPKEVERVDLFD